MTRDEFLGRLGELLACLPDEQIRLIFELPNF